LAVRICRRNDTEQGKAVTITGALAHALAARPAGKEITLNDHHLTTVIR